MAARPVAHPKNQLSESVVGRERAAGVADRAAYRQRRAAERGAASTRLLALGASLHADASVGIVPSSDAGKAVVMTPSTAKALSAYNDALDALVSSPAVSRSVSNRGSVEISLAQPSLGAALLEHPQIPTSERSRVARVVKFGEEVTINGDRQEQPLPAPPQPTGIDEIAAAASALDEFVTANSSPVGDTIVSSRGVQNSAEFEERRARALSDEKKYGALSKEPPMTVVRANYSYPLHPPQPRVPVGVLEDSSPALRARRAAAPPATPATHMLQTESLLPFSSPTTWATVTALHEAARSAAIAPQRDGAGSARRLTARGVGGASSLSAPTPAPPRQARCDWGLQAPSQPVGGGLTAGEGDDATAESSRLNLSFGADFRDDELEVYIGDDAHAILHQSLLLGPDAVGRLFAPDTIGDEVLLARYADEADGDELEALSPPTGAVLPAAIDGGDDTSPISAGEEIDNWEVFNVDALPSAAALEGQLMGGSQGKAAVSEQPRAPPPLLQPPLHAGNHTAQLLQPPASISEWLMDDPSFVSSASARISTYLPVPPQTNSSFLSLSPESTRPSLPARATADTESAAAAATGAAADSFSSGEANISIANDSVAAFSAGGGTVDALPTGLRSPAASLLAAATAPESQLTPGVLLSPATIPNSQSPADATDGPAHSPEGLADPAASVPFSRAGTDQSHGGLSASRSLLAPPTGGSFSASGLAASTHGKQSTTSSLAAGSLAGSTAGLSLSQFRDSRRAVYRPASAPSSSETSDSEPEFLSRAGLLTVPESPELSVAGQRAPGMPTVSAAMAYLGGALPYVGAADAADDSRVVEFAQNVSAASASIDDSDAFITGGTGAVAEFLRSDSVPAPRLLAPPQAGHIGQSPVNAVRQLHAAYRAAATDALHVASDFQPPALQSSDAVEATTSPFTPFFAARSAPLSGLGASESADASAPLPASPERAVPRFMRSIGPAGALSFSAVLDGVRQVGTGASVSVPQPIILTPEKPEPRKTVVLGQTDSEVAPSASIRSAAPVLASSDSEKAAPDTSPITAGTSDKARSCDAQALPSSEPPTSSETLSSPAALGHVQNPITRSASASKRRELASPHTMASRHAALADEVRDSVPNVVREKFERQAPVPEKSSVLATLQVPKQFARLLFSFCGDLTAPASTGSLNSFLVRLADQRITRGSNAAALPAAATMQTVLPLRNASTAHVQVGVGYSRVRLSLSIASIGVPPEVINISAPVAEYLQLLRVSPSWLPRIDAGKTSSLTVSADPSRLIAIIPDNSTDVANCAEIPHLIRQALLRLAASATAQRDTSAIVSEAISSSNYFAIVNVSFLSALTLAARSLHESPTDHRVPHPVFSLPVVIEGRIALAWETCFPPRVPAFNADSASPKLQEEEAASSASNSCTGGETLQGPSLSMSVPLRARDVLLLTAVERTTVADSIDLAATKSALQQFAVITGTTTDRRRSVTPPLTSGGGGGGGSPFLSATTGTVLYGARRIVRAVGPSVSRVPSDVQALPAHSSKHSVFADSTSPAEVLQTTVVAVNASPLAQVAATTRSVQRPLDALRDGRGIGRYKRSPASNMGALEAAATAVSETEPLLRASRSNMHSYTAANKERPATSPMRLLDKFLHRAQQSRSASLPADSTMNSSMARSVEPAWNAQPSAASSHRDGDSAVSSVDDMPNTTADVTTASHNSTKSTFSSASGPAETLAFALGMPVRQQGDQSDLPGQSSSILQGAQEVGEVIEHVLRATPNTANPGRATPSTALITARRRRAHSEQSLGAASSQLGGAVSMPIMSFAHAPAAALAGMAAAGRSPVPVHSRRARTDAAEAAPALSTAAPVPSGSARARLHRAPAPVDRHAARQPPLQPPHSEDSSSLRAPARRSAQIRPAAAVTLETLRGGQSQPQLLLQPTTKYASSQISEAGNALEDAPSQPSHSLHPKPANVLSGTHNNVGMRTGRSPLPSSGYVSRTEDELMATPSLLTAAVAAVDSRKRTRMQQAPVPVHSQPFPMQIRDASLSVPARRIAPSGTSAEIATAADVSSYSHTLTMRSLDQSVISVDSPPTSTVVAAESLSLPATRPLVSSIGRSPLPAPSRRSVIEVADAAPVLSAITSRVGPDRAYLRRSRHLATSAPSIELKTLTHSVPPSHRSGARQRLRPSSVGTTPSAHAAGGLLLAVHSSAISEPNLTADASLASAPPATTTVPVYVSGGAAAGGRSPVIVHAPKLVDEENSTAPILSTAPVFAGTTHGLPRRIAQLVPQVRAGLKAVSNSAVPARARKSGVASTVFVSTRTDEANAKDPDTCTVVAVLPNQNLPASGAVTMEALPAHFITAGRSPLPVARQRTGGSGWDTASAPSLANAGANRAQGRERFRGRDARALDAASGLAQLAFCSPLVANGLQTPPAAQQDTSGMLTSAMGPDISVTSAMGTFGRPLADTIAPGSSPSAALVPDSIRALVSALQRDDDNVDASFSTPTGTIRPTPVVLDFTSPAGGDGAQILASLLQNESVLPSTDQRDQGEIVHPQQLPPPLWYVHPLSSTVHLSSAGGNAAILTVVNKSEADPAHVSIAPSSPQCFALKPNILTIPPQSQRDAEIALVLPAVRPGSTRPVELPGWRWSASSQSLSGVVHVEPRPRLSAAIAPLRVHPHACAVLVTLHESCWRGLGWEVRGAHAGSTIALVPSGAALPALASSDGEASGTNERSAGRPPRFNAGDTSAASSSTAMTLLSMLPDTTMRRQAQPHMSTPPPHMRPLQSADALHSQARPAPGVYLPLRTVYFAPALFSADSGGFAVVKSRVQLCNTSDEHLTAHVSVYPLLQRQSGGQQGLVTVWAEDVDGAPNDPSLPFAVKPAHRTILLRPRSFVMLPVQFAPPRGVVPSPDGAAGSRDRDETALCTGLLVVRAQPGGDTAHGGGGGGLRVLCKALLVGEARSGMA